MAKIDRLRLQLAVMLLEKRKRKMPRAELYMKDRTNGMTYVAIAEKYGVSHQNVIRACARYRNRMEKEKLDGK